MSECLLTLVESNSNIELAHLEVEGKTEGHGRIVIEDGSIMLRAITKAVAIVGQGEYVKVKATTLDGAVLRTTGSVSRVMSTQRPSSAHSLQLTLKIDEVHARESGKDPDESLGDAPEEIISNLAVPKLVASNAATTISVEISALGVRSTDNRSDFLVIDDNSYALQRRDLRVTWKPQPNQNVNSGIPLLAAVAYLHGAQHGTTINRFARKRTNSVN